MKSAKTLLITLLRNSRKLSLGLAFCGLAVVLGCNVQGPTSAGVQISVNPSTHTIKILPTIDPPGSVVASFDTSEALVNVAMTNASITTTNGTVTITATDANSGALLGQQSFGYVVRGSALYAQDPASVHNWLQQFANYANVTVSMATDNIAEQESGTSASVTASAQYQGTTYATAYKGWATDTGGSPCGNRPCPIPPNQN